MALIRKKKNSIFEWLDEVQTVLTILVDQSNTPFPVQEVSKKEDVRLPEKASYTPKASPKSFSIKGVIEGTVQESMPKVESEPKQAEPDAFDNDEDFYELTDDSLPISQLELEKKWQLFAQTVLSERPKYSSIISNYLPVLEEESIIKVDFESQFQIDLVGEIKNELLAYLKKALNNKDIALKMGLTSQEAAGKIYTVDDKFKYLSQLNPIIVKFKQQLNLDFD